MCFSAMGVTGRVGNGSGRTQEHLFLMNCNSFLWLPTTIILYAFFLAKSKVFLLQELHCNVALLSTQVVTYIVARIAMFTHLCPISNSRFGSA